MSKAQTSSADLSKFKQPASVKLGWVLRDMMQSTGVWTFETADLATLVQQAMATGFSSLEIGGGQSYQIALESGVNPYQIIRNAKQIIDQNNGCLPLQVLLRGANQLGFQHYDVDIQKNNIDLLIDAGGDADKNKTVIVRNFDALNDPENLRVSIAYMVERDIEAAKLNAQAIESNETPLQKRVHIQAALSYVQPASGEDDACYSTSYYLNYAKKLIAIASGAGGQLDSLCIKDMSGQLTPALARQLIPALKQLDLPVFLHCHSTDEARSLAVQTVAIQSGIDGIEVAIEPLAGGASHNDIENLCYLAGVVETNTAAIAELKQTLGKIFAERARLRKDTAIALATLKKLVGLGIPGGAIPFIVKDLQANICTMFGVELDEALELFEEELTSIQTRLGFVPLVTPTADIIAKQTIKSLGNRQRSEAYQLVDPRFCRLVLGHYGQVINHANDQVINVDPTLLQEIKDYCAAVDVDIDGQRSKSGRVYPDPELLSEHPAILRVEHDQLGVTDYVADLFERYPVSSSNFGTQDECIMMHIMRPAGKTDRLLTQNILRPTEARLRIILDETLHLLPGKDIPESREQMADETTDVLLLDALGDYDGIVNSIKDLVTNCDYDGIHDRLDIKMHEVIEPIVEVNAEAKANRYFIERRFVALFAAAVFWDLQRVCRRTGSDSRDGTDEMAARKLDRIISSTLRKRKREGLGQADRFLS